MKKVVVRVKKQDSQKEPPKTKNKLTISNKIDIVSAVLSFLSFLVVAFTLLEMNVERNATYKPKILLNPTQVSFSWDSEGNEERTDFSESANSSYEVDENGNINGTVSIPVSYLSDYKAETFDVVNLGVGNARDVVFEWQEDNLSKLNEFLIECDPSKKDFLEINQSAVFDCNGSIIMTNLPTNYRIMYMLSDAQETYELMLPMSYSILIHEIIKSGPHDKELPYLLLNAKYYDVQGKEHMDVFLIRIKAMLFSSDESGAGEASYQLVPVVSN